jgi:hypothetical protein
VLDQKAWGEASEIKQVCLHTLTQIRAVAIPATARIITRNPSVYDADFHHSQMFQVSELPVGAGI